MQVRRRETEVIILLLVINKELKFMGRIILYYCENQTLSCIFNPYI